MGQLNGKELRTRHRRGKGSQLEGSEIEDSKDWLREILIEQHEELKSIYDDPSVSQEHKNEFVALFDNNEAVMLDKQPMEFLMSGVLND